MAWHANDATFIQNQNCPAFSPYTQMPSVTPPTYNYQHGSGVTSQVTFPACSTLSSSDISQHQMPSTSRNDLEKQRSDTSNFKSHWPYWLCEPYWLWDDNMDFAKFYFLYQRNLNQLLNLFFPWNNYKTISFLMFSRVIGAY